jgi:hypothetical protein
MTAALSNDRPMRRQSVIVAVTAVLAVCCSLLGLTGTAHAAVSQSPAATYQTDGRVSAIVVVGNTVYLGGNFDSVRPSGAPDGTEGTSRSGLAAFNLRTGALLPWNPSVNHQVNALAASPDGRVIYVGGRFGRIHGQQRANLAAVRAGSGKLTKFRADTNGRVLSIATRGDTVYVGGKFTHLGGRDARHLAALTRRGHLRPSFRGSADGFVLSIAVGAQGRTLFLGGEFRHVDGKRNRNLAKLSRRSGRVQRLHAHPAYPVTQVVVQGRALYLAGNGVGGHVASYTTDGKKRWVRQVDGKATSVATVRRTLYVGGQFHNICAGNTRHGGSGFKCPTVLAPRQRMLAVSRRGGTLSAWNPGANSVLGVFALMSSSSGLHVGGEFTTLGSTGQEGYGRLDLPNG